MKNKATYELRFLICRNKYMNDDLMANIIINDIKTNYYVDTKGNIYSSNFSKNNVLKKRKICKVKNKKDKDNPYYIVHLSVNNNSYNILVHRLVAGAFLPNPDNKPEVNHKDGNKSNNNVDNLEWCTSKENIIHAYSMGLKKQNCGEKNHNAKIKKKEAKKICRLLEENKLTIKEISEIIGCNKSIIMNIRQKKAWTDVSKYYNIDNYSIKESTNGNKRMSESTVIKICTDLSSGLYSIKEISKKYNVPYSRVNDIKQRKTWSKISYLYDFTNYNIFK